MLNILSALVFILINGVKYFLDFLRVHLIIFMIVWLLSPFPLSFFPNLVINHDNCQAWKNNQRLVKKAEGYQENIIEKENVEDGGWD